MRNCWWKLTCFLSVEHTIAFVERGDMISSGNGVTTKIVVIVGESRDQYLLRCNRVSSKVGADTPYSNAWSTEKRWLLLSLCLLLWRTWSPISPAFETISLSMSSSIWTDAAADKLIKRVLNEELAPLVQLNWSTSSGFRVSSPNIHDFPPEPQDLIPLGITSIVTEIN